MNEKSQGYNGIYLFNESIKQENEKLADNPDAVQIDETKILVNSNISQLTEIYDRVSAVVVIINNLLSDYDLDESLKNSMRELLLLNLGENFRINVEQVSKFIDWYNTNSTDLCSTYISIVQVSRLSQLVDEVRVFYNNTLTKKICNFHSIRPSYKSSVA